MKNMTLSCLLIWWPGKYKFVDLYHILLTAAHPTCVFPMCPADSIEANVENADVHVQNATQQLARAAEYQVKTS